jgi:hypothetical protein
MFLERIEEVKGVHHNKLPSNQVKHIANGVVNDEELVKDVNPIPLKERLAEDMEGDESTSNSSSEEKFAPMQYEGLNEPQQDGRRERPQRQHKKWLRDWWVATKEVEQATIVFSEELQTVEETLNDEDAKKWEIAMHEEYDYLVVNNICSLVGLGFRV